MNLRSLNFALAEAFGLAVDTGKLLVITARYAVRSVDGLQDLADRLKVVPAPAVEAGVLGARCV